MDMGVARSGLGDDRTMQVVGMVVMVVVDRQAPVSYTHLTLPTKA